MAHCDVALAASGTVTVEAALLGAPMVTFYRVTALSWAIGRLLVNVPFYSMVNLIAGKRVVPELMQGDMTGERMAAETARLLDNAAGKRKMKEELARVAARLPRRRGRCDHPGRRRSGAIAGGFEVKTTGLVALGVLMLTAPGFAQDDKRAHIDVDSYTIDAQINPDTQTVTARAAVRFIPLDDQTTAVTFELNNALNISRITDDKGQTCSRTRNHRTIRFA